MAQNILIGCLPDWLQQSGATVTAESEVASLPDDNLLDTSISKVWRSNGNLTTTAGVYFDLASSRDWDTLALANHNLPDGSYYRIGYGTGSLASKIERVAPNGITAVTGSVNSGTVGDIDDDVDSLDGNFLEYTPGGGGSDTSEFRIDFATPSSTPDATDGNTHAFRFKFDADDAELFTAISVSLQESSSTKQSLTVNDMGDGYYVAFWDASNLATASGAAVQAFVSITGSAGVLVTIQAIDWISTPNTTNATFTEWQRVVGATSSWGGASLSTISSRTTSKTVPHVFTSGGTPTAITGRYGRIDFITPGGTYVEAGRLAVGRSFYGQQLVDNFDVGVMDPTEYRRSKGGQLWRRVRQAYRVATLPLFGNQSDILRDVYDVLYRRLGSTGDFLLAIFPDSTTDAPILSWWATLRPESRSIRGETGKMDEADDAIWTTTLEVEEVL